MRRFAGSFGACCFLIAVAAGEPARAALSLPSDPSSITDFSSLIPQGLANTAVRTLGLATDHRPYEPATPLGVAIGVDVSLEVTLVKVPDDFSSAMDTLGISLAGSLPFLPVPRLHLHKGLGESVDLGVSYMGYTSYRIIGGDLKIVLLNPEEGPTWAMRFCYARADISYVSTRTYTPQLLMSRRLEFADPYIGIGYEYATGEITVPLPKPDLPSPPPGVPTPSIPDTITKAGNGGGGLFFLGVGFKPPHTGLKLTLEGAYSTAGASSIGTKFGFNF